MVQFNDWCDSADTPLGNHHVRVMTGRPADAATGIQVTATAVPAHYAAEERIAAALARLGKAAAAQMITDLLPQTPQIRSGDLGEIYATEWIDAHSGYRAPIKRLRWKDHRNMAMRGDDVIGMLLDPANPTPPLPEDGSEEPHRPDRAQTLEEARTGLDKDGGLPSSHALSFISARLMELGTDAPLVDAIDEALYRHGIPPESVKHLLFTFSGQLPAGSADQAHFMPILAHSTNGASACTWRDMPPLLGPSTIGSSPMPTTLTRSQPISPTPHRRAFAAGSSRVARPAL
jgi:hypothetical protein